MTEKLVDFLQTISGRPWNGREGLDTITGAEYAALLLFGEIEKHLGKGEACRIFTKFGTPPSARRLNQIKNLTLLDMYDLMEPEPNVQRLAWKIATENRSLPPDKRFGPRGTTNPMTLDKHIRRLLSERDGRPKKD
jgi:hypothetical protein